MLYREIISVSSEIHKNTLCGQNLELLNVNLVLHLVNTGLWGVNITRKSNP